MASAVATMSLDPSAGEIGGIVAGVIAVLATVGAGIKWLLGWNDGRESTRTAKLDAWQKELTERERSLDERQLAYQEKTERELSVLASWAIKQQAQLSALRSAYQLIASAMHATDPRNPALAMANELLKAAIPLEPDVPPDIARILTSKEGGDGPD